MLDINKLYTLLKERIIKRTKSGYDVQNQPFKPYSKQYAKKKKSNKVDLTLTGQMLNSLQINADGLSVQSGFARDKQVYNAKNDRYFFDVTDQDRIVLQNEVYKQTQQYIKLEFKRYGI